MNEEEHKRYIDAIRQRVLSQAASRLYPYLYLDPRNGGNMTHDKVNGFDGTVPICGAKLARCVCCLTEHPHTGPHECDLVNEFEPSVRCMGKWNTPEDIVMFPMGAATVGEALADSLMLQTGGLAELRTLVRKRARQYGKELPRA